MRRAPMQADGPYYLPDDHPHKGETKPPGTITWAEHLQIHVEYEKRFGHDCQSAERLAERGGFSFYEARDLLGYEPKTWHAR